MTSPSPSPESQQATNATPAYQLQPASDGGGAPSLQDPSAESTIHRKRRRRTIACAPCRNRKVKCDFGYPTCNRCMKGPGRDACMYESPVHVLQHQHQNQQSSHASTSASAPLSISASSASWRPQAPEPARPNAHALPPPPPHFGVSEKQQADENRLRELERLVQNLTQASASPSIVPPVSVNADAHSYRSQLGSTPARRFESSPQHDVFLQKEQWRREVPNRHRFDGKETRTRFWGCSNGSKLSFELEGLGSFMKELKATSSLRTLHDEIQKIGYNKRQKPLSGDLATDSNFLKSLLPRQPVVENLVNCYFSYIGRMHHILHMPSFRAQLNELWGEASDIPCHFIVQLLLVMASVWSVNTPSPVTAAGTKIFSHAVVTDWIRWSEAWLFHANIKRPNLVVLQVRCLLLIAKEANYTQKNQAWSSAGTLVKLAMSAGCHREPPADTKISVLNREMRRRIWATILELDLQASLDRGMPPTMQQSDYDCSPPLNINDEDICESTTVRPEEKPMEVMTDSSFQVALMQSMDLRLRICALVNSPRVSLSSNELSLLEEEIKHSLSNIPDWQDTNPDLPNAFVTQKQQKLLWRTLLESNLRRCQLSLYTYSALGGLQGPVNSHATQARLEVAVVILCQQQLLIDNVGKLAWCALSDVTFHAAFTICHHLHASDSGFTSSIVRQVIPSITDILISLLQKTLSWLEEKFLVLEKGMREYYFLCVSITLVKTKLWPESASTFQQQAADRLRILSYNLFSRYIGDPGNTHENSRKAHPSQKPNLVAPSGVRNNISSIPPEQQFVDHPVLPDEAIDFGVGFSSPLPFSSYSYPMLTFFTVFLSLVNNNYSRQYKSLTPVFHSTAYQCNPAQAPYII
ncbi:hypothetical protein AJ78_05916 [Emergomyces pasteurianus Ep9510]|uniref:Zn(2)-C6 fungal-type domain-containing protein n=1 Tax=Emergomyces pasteurianus Ep9510 TaxID=1447872 RepID=A0A1J9Q0D6_9EURO|nr:hypothetical protein AJ78_05916 [Emergomyces pasteurianus Ep9510]